MPTLSLKNKFFSIATWLTIVGLLGLLLLGQACKSKSKSSSEKPAPTATPGTPSPIIETFAGISNITEVSESTATIAWPTYATAQGYKILYRVGNNPAWTYLMYTRSTVTSYTATGLTPSTTYHFNVQAMLKTGVLDGNQVEKAITTSAPPPQSPPAGLSLKVPEVRVSFNRTPTITAHYVSPGETIRLYTDSACQAGNLVATKTVEAGQSRVDLTTSTLPAGPQEFNFYATSTSTSGITSACSRAHVNYKLAACPNENFVPVEGSFELDTDSFCVMRVEARKDGSSNISANYTDEVWTNIKIADAKTKCKGLGTAETSCNLLSNAQWMTMARDIEATAANWSNGEVGSGMLNRGHSDGNPSAVKTISDSTNDWSDTGNNNSTWAQKRTHVLSNGSIVWDLAGNAAEFVDWLQGTSSFSTGPTSCADSSTDPFNVNCPELAPNDYLPGNPAGINSANYTAATYGVGRFYGTSSSIRSGSYPGVAVRGEQYNKAEKCGVFALSLNQNRDSATTAIGFRCACTQYP